MRKHRLKFASYKTKNDIFEAVRNGSKTIETRPATPNYSKILPGDVLICISTETKDVAEKVVVSVKHFESAEKLAEYHRPSSVVPSAKTSEDLINAFNDFKKLWGSSYANKLDKYGILAIEIS